LLGGINSFGYVAGRPLSAIDSLGLSEALFWPPLVLPDGQVINPMDGYVDFSSESIMGVYGHGRGIYYVGRYSLRRSGFFGKCERQRAEREGEIFDEMMSRKNVRDGLMEALKTYVRLHPFRSGARLATGTAVTVGAGNLVGSLSRGVAVSYPIAFTAGWGDALRLLEDGVATYDRLAATIFWWEHPNRSGGAENCSCD